MYRKIVSLLCITLLLSSCSGKKQEQKEDDFVSMDLPQLKAQGEITAVTLYSSTSYFQYKMEPMGYEYDLIKVSGVEQRIVNLIQSRINFGIFDCFRYVFDADYFLSLAGNEVGNRSGTGIKVVNHFITSQSGTNMAVRMLLLLILHVPGCTMM